jgi:rhodanese-related sulfurtransferase
LEPEDYHAKLGEENTVVIDVRNTYESDIGRFGAQEGVGGAKLLVPDMRKSTDFPAWIEKEETKEQLKGKNVLMYCTGGVRCERASGLLKSICGDEVAGVYQLQGGIEKYLQKFPEGGYWQGKNFVFDKREAIGVGCFGGVGGIVQSSAAAAGAGAGAGSATAAEKEKIKNKKEAVVSTVPIVNTTVPAAAAAAAPKVKVEVLGKCCACACPWDRYVGKKKCVMCGVPVLLCMSCSTAKGMLDREKDKEKDKKDGEKDKQQSASTGGEGEKGGAAKQPKLSKRQRIKEAIAAKKREEEAAKLLRLQTLRCPLCVAENITVPADQIIFTANGTKAVVAHWDDEGGGGGGGGGEFSAHSFGKGHSSKAASSSATFGSSSVPGSTANKKITFFDDGDEGEEHSSIASAGGAPNSSSINGKDAKLVPPVGKAATTVCKWGGGYSNREEKGKSAKKRKLNIPLSVAASSSSSSAGFSGHAEGEGEEGGGGQNYSSFTTKINKPCKWGSACNREGCWFRHS